MSAALTNNANGGVNGATVNYYNCGDGSGDHWEYISIGAGSTAIYSNEVGARGGMSYKFTTNASTNPAYLIWNQGSSLPDTYVRFSTYLPTPQFHSDLVSLTMERPQDSVSA